MGDSYIVWNGAMVTTAAPVPVTTGTSIKTMLQIVPAIPITVIAWGYSLDAAPATPGTVELIHTGTVAATVTAYAVADVMPFHNPYALANTSGTSGVPLNLGTALSGYTSSGEGSITATRLLDVQKQNGPYVLQGPLGREAGVPAAGVLRVRMTFGTAVNAICWVAFEA